MSMKREDDFLSMIMDLGECLDIISKASIPNDNLKSKQKSGQQVKTENNNSFRDAIEDIAKDGKDFMDVFKKNGFTNQQAFQLYTMFFKAGLNK